MPGYERIVNPDGSAIVQCYRRTLEQIVASDRTSADLRAKIEKLLADARYDIIWVHPDGVTDIEFESHLEQVRRKGLSKPG